MGRKKGERMDQPLAVRHGGVKFRGHAMEEELKGL